MGSPVLNPLTPVFIVGSYRSGTSILTWAIGSHPHFRPLEETGWIVPYGAGALAGYEVALAAPRNFFDIYGVSRGEYIAHVRSSIDQLIMKASAKVTPSPARRRWVDGTPENTKHILLLRELFPAAKFIFLVRDPIDTVASMMYFNRAGGVARSLGKAGQAWSSLTRRGLLAFRAFGPDVVKIVLYAELVDKPTAVLESIFDFLGDGLASEAESMMQERINSSHVTQEERESIRRRLGRSRLGRRLKQRYDKVLCEMAAPWSRDEGALHELESLQPLSVATLTSQFGLVRWVSARLREKFA